jgi:hypothetical protein
VLRRPGRLAASLAAAASVSLILAAGAAADAASPAEQQLVDAYAPILKLRQQENGVCKTTVEQYKPPTTVDTVLDNKRVKLIHYVDGKEVVVKTGPTASDIASLGDDYYLDLPGDPLGDTCEYAKDFAKLKAQGKTPPVTYAHIAREPGHSGLVVQYFFFYYFNQFNDLHEGDWEGIQIAFDADTPAEALEEGPSQIALFQHAGGERADWDDEKVQKDGTHPIVYPAAGSHATFYDNAVYIQNGQNGSGVGCDNTSEPLIQADPQPIIVPTAAAPGSKFQWLGFLGHWGQREKGFNNGPQGPTTKGQWLRPFTWMDGVRQTSPRLPGGAVLGPAASTAFCGAIESVSEFINLEAKTTIGAIGLGIVLLLLIVVPPLFTRWRPVDLSTLRHEWSVGQLLRGARQLYGRHWRIILAIALSGFVILAAIQGIQYVFAQLAGSGDIRIHPLGLTLEFNGSIGVLAYPIGSALVSGAVVAFVHQREEGKAAGVREDYREIGGKLWRVVGAQLLVDFFLALMFFTVVGIPFAIYFYVAWQFVQQEILFENRSIRESLRGSRARVRGHWWRTVVVTAILALIGVVIGPVLGFFLIFLNLSAVLVNLIGSIIYALVFPYVALGRTLLYLDLCARGEAEEAAGLVRRRWFSRARPATGTT